MRFGLFAYGFGCHAGLVLTLFVCVMAIGALTS